MKAYAAMLPCRIMAIAEPFGNTNPALESSVAEESPVVGKVCD
jgi:hypothetical protein